MDGKLRDWRGLVDFVHLDPSERSKVEAAQNHTSEIISIWSVQSNIIVLVNYSIREFTGYGLAAN